MKNIIKILSTTLILTLGLSACEKLTTSSPNTGHSIYVLKDQTIRTDKLLALCRLPDKQAEFYNIKNSGLKCLKEYSLKGYHVASYHYGNILYMIYEHDLKLLNLNKKYKKNLHKAEKIKKLNELNQIRYHALQYLNLSASSVVRLYNNVHDMNKYKLEDRLILSESVNILEKDITSQDTKKKIENGIRVLSDSLVVKTKKHETNKHETNK